MKNNREDYWIFRWNTIEKLASNEISKVIGLIPLAGYLILFNDGLVETLAFNKIAGTAITDESPFFLTSIDKLRLVFFGSIFLFTGSALFRIFSPKELEIAKNELDFSDRVLASYSKGEIADFEKYILSDNWTTQTPQFEQIEKDALS